MNLDDLRRICLSFPATSEEIKWGNDLVFMVGKKMFCVTCTEPPHYVSFKVPDESFEELVLRPGIIPAPYMARAKWIQVQEHTVFHKDEWLRYLEQSYHLVAARLTKKEKKELGIGG